MQFLDMNWFVSGIRTVMAAICQFLYPLISNLYNLFINISKVNILSSDQLKPIYQRVTLILTIVMVFYVTFECVKYIVQPDGLTDKEKGVGNIVYKMVLVVVLIAFVPTIFEGAYKLQNMIIEKNVIGKVIMGNGTDVNPGQLGSTFSSSVLSIGYTVPAGNEEADCGELKCGTLVNMNLSTLTTLNKLPYLTMGLDKTVKEKTPTASGEEVEVPAINFEFHGFLSVAIGAVVVYILVLYCVDVGVRWAQLIYLQVISPIAIIGYLSPKKDGIFQKWCKQCLTTYLDLFIRTSIIYLILLICSILLDAYHNPSANDLLSKVDPNLRTWVFIFLVLGMLMFAQKAPKMLGELFPKMGAASGNLGLALKDRPAVARAAGMAVGAGLVGARKAIGSGINRFKRNRQNKAERGEKQENYNKRQQEYDAAKRERNRLRRQARSGGPLTVKGKDINGNETERKVTDKKEKEQLLAQAEKELKDRRIDRDSAKAAVNNTKHRFAGFSAVAGGVTGAMQGAKAGFNATDAKGIVKGVKEGFKAADASLAKTEKWYNEGGGSYIDRAINAVETSLGVSTSSDRITNDIKTIDENIKGNEVLIAAESDTKSKRDDVEKRLESKLESGELKTTVDDEGLKYLQSKVPGVTVNKNDKLSDVYARTKVATESAKSNLDTIIKTNGAESKEAKEAQKALQIAQDNETKMKKHAMRAAYSYMLQHPNDDSVNDAVAKGKLATMQESISNARRNLSTVESFEKATTEEFTNKLIEKFGEDAVKNGTYDRNSADYKAIQDKYNSQLEAFRGNTPFKDYDELDEIVVRLQNIADNRMRENMSYKETKRRIEASDATAAAKANNSASSGK